jgi:hypothetical protein
MAKTKTRSKKPAAVGVPAGRSGAGAARPDQHRRRRVPGLQAPGRGRERHGPRPRRARAFSASIRQRLALRSPRSVTAASAAGKQPHDDDHDDRDQPDNEKRLEHWEDPANGREGKPDGEDRAEDCPDYPAHATSMRPAPRWAAVMLDRPALHQVDRPAGATASLTRGSAGSHRVGRALTFPVQSARLCSPDRANAAWRWGRVRAFLEPVERALRRQKRRGPPHPRCRQPG